MDMNFDMQELIGLLMAFTLGGLIGIEREINGKPAGLRTNIIICVGAAAFTVLGRHFAGEATEEVPEAFARLAAGIITGVGFLGGGVLIREGSTVHGLTTAASIWLVTSIGIACGIGSYALAITVTLLALVVLLGLSPVAHRIRDVKDEEHRRDSRGEE
ncbi:magnesium transport protein MgtC [Anaerohalosphaera lusitana]|uniref:Magnesium transport protein MgtC n=1 Tax=Anaerohalosphaera lusitana TaxID=1936003 RepID=A0A1U9NI93_9BACT|nr:MgtC/SapB family protein [Anaerohalosphaera lusitana]AQT67320.1 magnesium transport protein MgtC [Anaerohalosphaera lusitana]